MGNFKLTLGKNGIIPKLRIGDDQNKFQIVINTTITGGTGSNSNTFVLPTFGAGYNALVEWGDGSSQRIIGTPGNVTKIYSRPGIYTVKIGGLFPRIYFNNVRDKLKLKEIKNWGNIVWGSMVFSFFGCENMVATYKDSPVLTNCVGYRQMFQNCYRFNGVVDGWNLSVGGSMYMMFRGCSSFNKPVNNIVVSNTVEYSYLFYQCSIFNQDLSNWNFTYGSDFTSFLSSTSMSVNNYDKLLISISNQNVKNNVAFGCSAKYTKSPSDASTGRAHLADSIGSGGHGWTITDGGPTP